MVTHLCFADDLVIFTWGTKRSTRELGKYLQLFEEVSGQRINRNKSGFIISMRCPLHQVRALTHILGIKKTTLPLDYLGCSLYQGRTKAVYFQPLIDKVANKLNGWKGRLLSAGGRLTLVRHVLQVMPIY